MIDWTALGVIVSASALVVTLVLFMIQSSRRARERRERSQHDAVSRVLSTMEPAIKRQVLYGPFSILVNPDLDYTLIVPRLIHELPKEDHVVGEWVLEQTGAMRRAPTDRRAHEIGVAMSLKLVEWNRGEVDRVWFSEELRKARSHATHGVRRLTVRRRLSQTASLAVAGAGVVVAYEAVRRCLGELKKI